MEKPQNIYDNSTFYDEYKNMREKQINALAAITINAAKHVGLENRIGSLASGKDADIVIMSGELFTLNAKVKAVFLNGQQMI